MARRASVAAACLAAMLPSVAMAEADAARPDAGKMDSSESDAAKSDAAKSDAAKPDAVKSITVRAQRDIGFFAGDLVRAEVDLVVDPAFTLDEASLPRAGQVAYWLNLRKVSLLSRSRVGDARRYTLQVLYQNFYDALDARQQEIPGLPLRLSNGKETVAVNVPAWTIGVSPLREIAPPQKEDPKDYMRADAKTPPVHRTPYFWGAAGAALAAALALVPLAADRAWFPFQRRPARVFSAAARRLGRLAPRAAEPSTYLEGLLVLHRGIDQAHGQRVLADDVPAFLDRHRAYAPARDGLLRFFAASRRAFFGSDPKRAREDLGFDALQALARQLAAIERTAA